MSGLSVAQALPTITELDTADAAVLTAFASSVIFIVGYSLRAPWWRYRVGRALASLDVALGLALLPTCLRLVFHVNNTSVFYTWYFIISLFAVAFTTLWRLYTINYVHAHPEVDAPPPEEEVT